MNSQDISIIVDEGGRSQRLTAVTTSQQTTTINSDYALVYCTAPCFVRQGSNPTAVTTGADIFLAGNVHYRLNLPRGAKLAFAAPSAADVYVTTGG
jgi:hypothetical protein